MKTLLISSMALFAPVGLAAHPHVFVDTGLKVLVDETGALEAVEVTWRYDELYTLLLLQDMQLDEDLDGVLTPEEKTKIAGFDLNWIEGFEGDLYITRQGQRLALGAPQHVATVVDQNQIVSTHRRVVTGPAADTIIKAYDPTFYTAYTLHEGVEVQGACRVELTPADLNAAYAAVEELLFATPSLNAEEDFPKVGAMFADKVRLTC